MEMISDKEVWVTTPIAPETGDFEAMSFAAICALLEIPATDIGSDEPALV